LSLPDGTLVSPGETVTKEWRIENDGDCTWTPAYTWDQIDAAGNHFLGVPLSIPMPETVPPGGTLDISVRIQLDAGAMLGDVYTAQFQMRSPEGDLFGTHPFARIFAVNGTGVCPLGTGSLDPFINPTDRFCLLYPNDHDAYFGILGETTYFRAPSPDPGLDPAPTVSIYNKGNTAGLTVQQWALIEMTAAMGSLPLPPTSNTTVAGLPAVQTDGLPARYGHRVTYVIKDNTGFAIFVGPVDGLFPAETIDAIALWGIIRTHFVFYEP
jgi:hypothetical protein